MGADRQVCVVGSAALATTGYCYKVSLRHRELLLITTLVTLMYMGSFFIFGQLFAIHACRHVLAIRHTIVVTE